MSQRLDLSDKAVELLAYHSFMKGATFEDACAALWPTATPADAAAFYKQTVDEINRVARETTGNPSPVMVPAGVASTPPEPAPPKIMVRVLGKPYVEVVE